MTFKFNHSVKTRSVIVNLGVRLHVPMSATFHRAGCVSGVYFLWRGKWCFSALAGYYIEVSGVDAIRGMDDEGAAWEAYQIARKAKKA